MKLNTLLPILLGFILISGCKKDDGNPAPVTVSPKSFLSNENFNQLNIEVTYTEGFAPEAAALDELKTFLSARLNKPNGINISQRQISTSNSGSLSFEEIKSLEANNRTFSTQNSTLTAYIYYADVPYSESTSSSAILGIAYGESSIAMFKSSIEEYSGGLGEPSTQNLETAVLLHEFCHTLGLTNNGTPMVTPHEDAVNSGHCNNENCLMYYKVESNDLATIMSGGTIPSLDANCLQDLQANGGK